jgi:pimeloyl-ACP methyl ester carboxylesterase
MVSDLSVDELDDEAGLIMNAFFTQSEPSKAAGRAYIERLKLRAENRDASVSKQAALAEANAICEWGVIPQTDRFAMLGQIHHPTLMVHGSKDVVILHPDRRGRRACRSTWTPILPPCASTTSLQI